MSLELTDVTVSFPDGDDVRHVLDGLDLSVAAGEAVALTGPSGSGKSTLLAVAGLLRHPDGGSVRLGGRECGDLGASERDAVRRDTVGLVFQQAKLLPALTALEQLELVARLRGARGKDLAAARERARSLLAEMDLPGVEGLRPHQLSGGQQQRISIARAIMGDPKVLLVDEPTSALDPARAGEVFARLVDIAREHDVATVVVTHDERHLGLMDRVLTMDSGRAVLADAVGGWRREETADSHEPVAAGKARRRGASLLTV
ncbi:ABC transporter ATP-binding protein [Kytococcus sp. HMSC28H12]|uniref:ABC transporter ATP-binding protein n=1 Tax=Kytococcus sp. HMSC28H12 TaxID=1581067 RepID=UPI0008A5559B|nr:ABC transporter ATP-binding protein [Kytococcus sp. HMSC28H12]OFS15384.1 ABC transporter ATP-binding protein [Kytococcus sp. HMSC28H12]